MVFKRDIGLLICGILFGFGLFFLGFKFLFSTPQAGTTTIKPQSQIQLPDYSGIKIRHTVVREIKKGEGAPIGAHDQIQAFLRVWIYDPSAPKNKGDLVYESSSREPELIRDVKLLEGLSAGSLNEYILPAHESFFGKGQLYQGPEKTIFLIELLVLDVL